MPFLGLSKIRRPSPSKRNVVRCAKPLLAVDRTMTIKPRAQFIERLQQWIDDLENAKAAAKMG